MAFHAKTELRKFNGPKFDRVLQLLNDGEKSWRKLALHIPKGSDNPYVLMYSRTHIDILEAIEKRGDNPASCLLDDWGTRGRNRPTIKDLYNLLVKTGMIRIAHEISECIQDIPEPPRLIQLSEIFSLARHDEDTSNIDHNIRRISYNQVDELTGSFPQQRIIGEGTFGVVYYGEFQTQKVAVKRLRTELQQQFKNEVGNILSFQHPNLLHIIAYSDDNPEHCCIVYEYMCNGNLMDRLACKGGTQVLDWKQRTQIALGTARGIVHLHTSDAKSVLIHRDIKTANILLDHEWVPKVGDYGLVHFASNSTTIETRNGCGTVPYMPREAFRGIITPKIDTYSFGVVLLELVTGLAPIDPLREEHDLVTHLEDNYLSSAGSDKTYADPLTVWPAGVSDSMFTLGTKCLHEKYKERPYMAQVLASLEQLWGDKGRPLSR